MIGFCEDCGAKNTLGQDAVTDGILRFKCLDCGYPNAYAAPKHPEIPEHLSQVIKGYPDIVAAFLFKEGARPVIVRLPKGLTPSDMKQLGQHLTMSFMSAHTIFPGIQEQIVSIADKHIIMKKAGQDCFLFLVSNTVIPPGTVNDLFQTLREGHDD